MKTVMWCSHKDFYNEDSESELDILFLKNKEKTQFQLSSLDTSPILYLVSTKIQAAHTYF